MPSYKVVAPGFDGKLYHPEGRRKILHREKPFPSKNGKEQVPSWLEPMKESAKSDDDEVSVKELKRKLTELNVEFSPRAKKGTLIELLATAEAAAAVEQDRAEIEGANFMVEGEQSPPVQNL